jgi:hypothetical protein
LLHPQTGEEAGYVLLVAAAWALGCWIAFKELLYDVASALRNLHFAERQREALRARPPTQARRARRFLPNGNDLSDLIAALRDYYYAYFARSRQPLDEEKAWFKYDVIRDSHIDGWFYFAGATTAFMMYAAPLLAAKLGYPRLEGLLPALTFFTVLVASIPLSQAYLWGNVAFDRAQLPFVGRFALNSRPLSDSDRKRALAFALNRDRAQHLIIIGPPKSGRTTAAVALGVEALLRSNGEVVVYTTFYKLLDRIAEEKVALQGPPGTRPVWPPSEAELLIIDDVGAQGEQRPMLDSQAFEAELQQNAGLCQRCKDRSVIWVVGDDPSRAQNWESALQNGFGGALYVQSVKLAGIVAKDERLDRRSA